MICAFCSKEIHLESTQVISRQESCANCHRDLRCCLNCAFYDKNSHWECKETVSEHVIDKEKSNFCDNFKANLKTMGSGIQENAANSPAISQRDALLKAADSLFKKS